MSVEYKVLSGKEALEIAKTKKDIYIVAVLGGIQFIPKISYSALRREFEMGADRQIMSYPVMIGSDFIQFNSEHKAS